MADDKVRSYLPLVDFLSEIAGPNSEVVLFDVREAQGSLVAIRNGVISGRKEGSPLSDFALGILRRGRREGKNFISNYLGKSGGSGKVIKSSTFFIRASDGEIIGMLGINSDLTAFSHVHRILGDMLDADEIQPDDRGESIMDTALSVIEQVIGGYAPDPTKMTTDEKKEAVEALQEKGVFLIKGTVSEVASRLEVSEQTIYRYLKDASPDL
jgi:predicted transcriptional regulator YheO